MSAGIHAFRQKRSPRATGRRTFGARRLVVLGIALTAILGSLAGASPSPFLKVPFYPDKTDQCGPATLAAILTFYGQTIEPKALREEMYTAKLHGTLPMDLLLTAKKHGLQTEMVRGDLETLKRELEAGRPVLAMLNLGFSTVPVSHYVVVTGLDPQRHGILAHSAGKANQFFSNKKFLKAWEKADNWALLTRP